MNKDIEEYNKLVEEENKAWKGFLDGEKAKLKHEETIARMNLAVSGDMINLLQGIITAQESIVRTFKESIALIAEQQKKLDTLMKFYPDGKEDKEDAKKKDKPRAKPSK